jgi:glycosyltransferase involved in cell wall biosynthesis
MRICMILSTPFPPEEGIGYYVYNLSKTLMRKGHTVTVITRGGLTTELDSFEGIRIIRAPSLPVYPFHVHFHGFFVNRIIKANEGNFDIIHIHTPLSPTIDTSLPMVSTVHTSVKEDALYIEVVDAKSFCTKLLTEYVSVPIVAKTIAISESVMTVANSVAQELGKHYAYDGALVVGNGVDECLLEPRSIKPCDKYILFIGRLSYRKGLFDLLECAKVVCRRYGIKFILVGKGELEQKIRNVIEKEGLQDKIILVGHQNREELVRLYQNATIFVLPSHYEGLPTVLLEAMSCGLPVVATNVSGCPDVVSDGENGVLIPAKSPEMMVEAISRLLDDEALRNDLGKNARKTIEEHNTWDRIAGKIEACYQTSLGLQ